MKFGVWHLLVLMAYAGMGAAFLSAELSQTSMLACLIVTLLCLTVAVAFSVYGHSSARAFAIGAGIPLLFLSLKFVNVYRWVEPVWWSYDPDDRFEFKLMVGVCWLLVVVCGTIVAVIESVSRRTNQGTRSE